MTETIVKNYLKNQFTAGRYIRLNGYLSWPMRNSPVQLNIINSGLTKIVREQNINIDIAWNHDETAVLVNPHPHGMVKLYEGVGEVYCSAEKLIPKTKAHTFFKHDCRYRFVEVYWYGDPRFIFYDRVEYMLLGECDRRKIEIQVKNMSENSCVFEIKGHPFEIILLKPGEYKSNINHKPIIWEGLGKKIIRLSMNKLKNDKHSGIILHKEWGKITELKEYQKNILEELNIKLFFTDFSKKNWAKRILSKILEWIR
ncbi:MAG: hypothetical protein ACTSQY_01680 [Candidatus Odinarchaeia archaeon]